MQRATTDVLYFEHSPENPPTMTVKPGEWFEVETQMNLGPWVDDLPPERRDYYTKKITGGNPSSGAIFVEGAEPGRMLSVHVGQIDVHGMGYTRYRGSSGAMPGNAPPARDAPNTADSATPSGWNVDGATVAKLPMKSAIRSLPPNGLSISVPNRKLSAPAAKSIGKPSPVARPRPATAGNDGRGRGDDTVCPLGVGIGASTPRACNASFASSDRRWRRISLASVLAASVFPMAPALRMPSSSCSTLAIRERRRDF